MSISSSFLDFSLAELFKLVEQGKKSGCLAVCTLPDYHATAKSNRYYIWFRQGRMVAAANRLDGKYLATKVTERGWLSQETMTETNQQNSAQMPLGLNLKTQGLLQSEQLNLLFASQLYQVRNLFEVQKGIFQLDSKVSVPCSEMTGLSMGATEVALIALRALKNWETLSNALPNPDYAVQTVVGKRPEIRLNALEWQIWEFAQGNVALTAVAKQINQSVEHVRQAAFRLIVAGLVEEIPPKMDSDESLMNLQFVNPYLRSDKNSELPKSSQTSMSFLQNLVGFLRSKC